MNEAAVTKDFAGSRTTGLSQTLNVLSCALVGVSTGGFPKTISIDFGTGTGCTPTDGVARSGKISVIISDSLRNSGCTAVMTFENYYVGGFKKEGTITWTYQNSGGIKSWERKDENGKITAPDGHYWVHSGTQTITQTGGTATPWDWSDDVFSTTGSATVTNSSGTSRTAEITVPLEKQVTCGNIDKGTIKIQGPSHYVTIDFGDGTCDTKATWALDGGIAIPFFLR